MNSFKAILAGMSIGLFSLPALSSENNFYFSVGGGNGNPAEVSAGETDDDDIELDADFDDSFIYDIEVGKKIENWRLGLSYTNGEHEFDEFTVSSKSLGIGLTGTFIGEKPVVDFNTLMFNVYRDFPTENKFSPYIGIGIGQSNVEFQDYSVTIDGTTFVVTDEGRDLFTWDIKGGVSYEVNNTTDLYGELSYMQTEEWDEDGIDYDGIGRTNLTAGIRFNF